jgi:lipoprotein-anchoring transpeptidase ErfK/SrfK
VRRLGALLAVVALATTACQAADASTLSTSTATPAVSTVMLSVSPASGARKVDPNDRVEVRAVVGTVTDVRVVDAKGHPVRGSLGSDGVWRSAGKPLAYDTTYTVTAQGEDTAGHDKVVQSAFRTVAPKARLTTSISPVQGQTVGVGMPVIVRLSSPVADRAAVQAALTVEPSRQVEGSWSWISDRELHWRPESYWPSDTRVTVGVGLKGVRAGRGVWGSENRSVTFTVGSSTISTVDVSTDMMTVTHQGEVIRRIPITTGKEGFRTRNGIKLIVSKERTRVMDAATIDIPKDSPDYYRLKVEYAMRLTWSGEFVHAAPWSVADQGRENVSHGCTGMSVANAEWFYALSKVGDPIRYTGSTRPLESGNGWTDWNISWAHWKAGSAL